MTNNKINKVHLYFYEELNSIDKEYADEFLIDISSKSNKNILNKSSLYTNMYIENNLNISPIHNSPIKGVKKFPLNKKKSISCLSLDSLEKDLDKYKSLIFTDISHIVPKHILSLMNYIHIK